MITERDVFEKNQMAAEEIRSMLRECNGKFQFGSYNACPGVEIESLGGEPTPFRVVEIFIDEDDDIMLSGDDFTEEVWETEGLFDVVGDGIQEIAEAMRRAARKDYIGVIDELREEMGRELWCVIEAHKDDERCDCPRQFDEVSFKHKHFCEVDLNGSTYDVDAVKLEHWPNRNIRMSIAAYGHWYNVYNVEEIAGILHAVRNTLDIPLATEEEE